MIKIRLTPILVGTIFFATSSCNALDALLERRTAKEVLTEVEATGGSIFYSTRKDMTTGIELKMIRLDVTGSRLLSNNRLTASYCATQLYNRMKLFTLNRIDGIKIVVDNDGDSIGDDLKYYYSKADLNAARKAINNTKGFMDCALKNDTQRALNYFDTGYYRINPVESEKRLAKELKDGYSKIYFLYLRIDVPQRNSISGSISCLQIISVILHRDNSKTVLSFLCPAYEADNKVISVRLPATNRPS